MEQTVTEGLSLGMLMCQLLLGTADCSDTAPAMLATEPCTAATPRYELVIGGAALESEGITILEERLTHPDICEVFITVDADGSAVLEIASTEDPTALVAPLLRPGKVAFFAVDETITADQPLPADRLMMPSIDGQVTYIVDRTPLLHHAALASVEADFSDYGDWTINLEFTDETADRFSEITTELLWHVLAIAMDGHVLSAPRINAPIHSPRVVITGGFTEDQARQMAALMNSGPLPEGLSVLSIETLSNPK